MKKYLLILIVAIFCLPSEGFAQMPSSSETIDPSQGAMASTWFVGKYGGTDGFNWNSKSKKIRKTKSPITKESLVAEMTTDPETGITTVRWNNGAVYVGEIYYAELNGKGTMTYVDGSKYIGNWSKDRRWGIGSMYYANGDVYHGEWMWDLPFGQGTFITAEGVAFTGKFEDGIPRGKCIIQDVDGRKYKARWGWGTGKLRKHSIRPLKEKK
jgi:hypothetical protein